MDLAETKSFTLAAERNGITESAVSQQLAVMECSFQSKLAARSNIKFQLTPAGEVFLKHSQEIVQIYDKLNHELEAMTQITADTIRITTTPYIGLYSLPPCLQRFQAEHPQVNVQVEYRRTDQICEDVLDNKADLGLIAHRVKGTNLEFIPFRKEPLVLICHPQHRSAQLKKIRLAAFKGQTFLSFEQGFPGFGPLEGILKRCQVEGRRIIEFNEIEPIKRAVAIGTGVAIVPEVTVRREVADRTLAALSIIDGDFSHPLLAVRNPLKKCTPVLKRFIGLLKKGHKPAPVKRFSSAFAVDITGPAWLSSGR